MPALALSAIAECLRESIPDQPRAEALVSTLLKAGARHSARDQALLDVAAHAMHKAMNMASCTKGDRMHLADAHKAVLDAGATNLGAEGREMLTDGNPEQGADAATEHSTVNTARNAETAVPNPTGASPASPIPASVGKTSTLEIIEALLEAPGWGVEKAGQGHRPLMEIAHHALAAMSDGSTCKADGGKPARHTGETMARLDKAHFHLTKCDGMAMACKAANPLPGGTPDADSAKPDGQGTEMDSEKSAAVADGELAKHAPGSEQGTDAPAITPAITPAANPPVAAAEANPNVDQLLKTMGTMAETLQAVAGQYKELRARVENIAQTPLPPRAIARVAGSTLTKSQDGVAAEPAALDVSDALARMSDDGVTKALIKRSLRTPKVVHGFTDGPAPMRAPRS